MPKSEAMPNVLDWSCWFEKKKKFPEAHRHTGPPRAPGTALQQTVEPSTVPQRHLNTRCHKEEEEGRDGGQRNGNCKGEVKTEKDKKGAQKEKEK